MTAVLVVGNCWQWHSVFKRVSFLCCYLDMFLSKSIVWFEMFRGVTFNKDTFKFLLLLPHMGWWSFSISSYPLWLLCVTSPFVDFVEAEFPIFNVIRLRSGFYRNGYDSPKLLSAKSESRTNKIPLCWACQLNKDDLFSQDSGGNQDSF